MGERKREIYDLCYMHPFFIFHSYDLICIANALKKMSAKIKMNLDETQVNMRDRVFFFNSYKILKQPKQRNQNLIKIMTFEWRL